MMIIHIGIQSLLVLGNQLPHCYRSVSHSFKLHLYQWRWGKPSLNVIEKWRITIGSWMPPPMLKRWSNFEKEIQTITLHCFPGVYAGISLFNLMPIFHSPHRLRVHLFQESFTQKFALLRRYSASHHCECFCLDTKESFFQQSILLIFKMELMSQG